jgi:catechol 2,3-dioxygenase-like lactoylglutathione lyase family enzyme
VRIVAPEHLVLTVADVEATVSFYEMLGMRREMFGGGRIALRFGDQKASLHQRGAEISPRAAGTAPGSADLCFLVAEPVEEVVGALARLA